MTDVIDELHRRGLIAQSTDEAALRAHLAEGPVTYYAGFDPTAQSLHVGHLLQFMVLRALQRAGHQPVVLVGGATGLIGDPRPSAERQLNDRDTVATWVQRIREQVAPFLEVPAEADGTRAPVYVDNLDWTAPVSAIDFLRELGKHFRVSQMLAKEAVSARLNSEAGISYTEFSYQILQANDFRELHRRHGVTLQTGGSDQWGNLTAGIDLVRRTEGARVHALSTPLVTKSDGTKFGKSEGGAVWLDPALTSPYAFFQFWLNADDADARAWLPLYSERPAEEVSALVTESLERPAARTAQRALAEELTLLVHGPEQLRQAEAAGRALFGREDLRSLDGATLGAALQEAGSITVDGELPTVAQLLQQTGLVGSLSEARRTVKEGGAYLNNERVTDGETRPGEDAWLPGGWLVLRRGRRSIAGVRRGA
ncbi:tyrosine--tRNA ligase [Blastococcus sp. MG754426]|uniref:tyrosine--tRNA ligase n=1 Tax=unclassified Blastococcus TaxID=2619396 RepID=UPI001EF15783|nr:MULTISPECIES: tyrosine--tRNA ligase [unclassified Blastococcus]MCF6510081.1 tyrosine--tRNA ligase [Blastococcus sp. MG754426]MCF6513210.1 tyrosine--tRNA ligase [Blastococcus sp. MG754427]MCF6737673.1 tyrosine--tRNA ligase [Blastococcus sp. KM273129]